MKATKKQFKTCALRIMCLLESRKVSMEYANKWYRIIATDFALDFVNADYQVLLIINL